jgi:DNA-binding transcriptional LysR family regulator
MELRQLRSFLKIVELQSFSRAAKALGYSQSALSVQIHGLEQELGVRLFDRMGKQVALTQPGKELFQHIVPVLHQLQEIRDVMQENPPAETLHLGMIQSLCKAKMPEVMEYFHKNHPNMNITITLDSPAVLLDLMEHNQVDFVYILDEPTYNIKWEKVLEKKEDIVFVGSVDSPLVYRNEVPLEELIRQPFFLTEKEDNYRRSLDQYLAARELEVKPFLEVSDTGFILDMVQRNMGFTFLPRYVMESSYYREKLKIVNVPNFHMSMYRQLFYHKNKWLTTGMKMFLEMVEKGMI